MQIPHLPSAPPRAALPRAFPPGLPLSAVETTSQLPGTNLGASTSSCSPTSTLGSTFTSYVQNLTILSTLMCLPSPGHHHLLPGLLQYPTTQPPSFYLATLSSTARHSSQRDPFHTSQLSHASAPHSPPLHRDTESPDHSLHWPPGRGSLPRLCVSSLSLQLTLIWPSWLPCCSSNTPVRSCLRDSPWAQ